MRIYVNSEPVELVAETTLQAWFSKSEYAQRACAVAVNETFVPRQARAGVVLREDDRLEVLEALQGG